MVVIVVSIALVIDVVTAMLTYRMSKSSMNIRAAFLHNVSDALASLGVIIAGTLIILYDWYWTDTALTLLIATYVLYQAASMLPKTIHILMQGAPEDIVMEELIQSMEAIEGVKNVHHVHVWQMDEHNNALEAHIVIEDFNKTESVKQALKGLLTERFGLAHSTLEFEIIPCGLVCGERIG